MKRKIYFICCIAVLTVTIASCKKDFLNENLQSTYGPDNTLVDELGFTAGIAGLQSLVRDQYAGDQGMISTMHVGTDVARNGILSPAQVPYENYALMNSQDVIAQTYWNWAYRVISAANLIIERAADPKAFLSDNARKSFTAEARFFRAFAYNFISTLFGGVPLVDKPLTAPKTDFTRAKVEDVINFIIDDLKYAADNLPVVTALKKEGRINKAAAQQLLAVAYLRANQPALAEQTLQLIISSGSFSLITSRYGIKKAQAGDPFADMFIYGNMRRSQGNTEALWVFEQNYNIPGGFTVGDQHRRVWVPFYINITGMVISDSLGGRGIGRIRPTNWWTYDLYNATDMRNSSYNIRRKFYYNDPASPNYGQQVVVTGADTVFKIYAYTTKWNDYNPLEPIGFTTYKDRIMMRLGETYLLLAEAQFKQGKLLEAANSINIIRARANVAPIPASAVTMDFILDERARELIAEELRRLTLVRTGTLIDRVRRYNPFSASVIQDKHALLPIPQSEINLNKDAKLEQNPGYQ
ncbi:MAG: RagB/SusD family nutrient uptake outer membrane protein [Chitinophagaceae bacterium]